ncbi:MAG: NAD(P)H-dependent oxidoreductase subunit E [Roseiflexaceae bacterium]|nr:NAD(P)H-dependent oxidoreductase subunit E [Roseiflexaceae bacterium]
MALRDIHGAEIDTLLARYAQRRSAVLPLLYIAQDTYGHLTDDAVREVAEIIGMPATDVFEVVGFYSLYYTKPMGKWVLQVCDDVPCCFCGAEELITALEQALGLRAHGETTRDGMFTLERVKCVAACNKAPVLQANLDYIYNLTADKADELLNELRRRADSGEQLSVSGRAATV